MPAEYPVVDEWPAKFNEGRTNQRYIEILGRLKSQPANKIRVVAVGLKKSDAMNLRAWLNDREGVTARTTGRKDQLERYGFDADKLAAPNNHIVLAQYSDAEVL